jgi:hypothetical protein
MQTTRMLTCWTQLGKKTKVYHCWTQLERKTNDYFGRNCKDPAGTLLFNTKTLINALHKHCILCLTNYSFLDEETLTLILFQVIIDVSA